MKRTLIVCLLAPCVAGLLLGCPKPKPKPPQDEIKMDTTKVEPPPAPPTQDLSRPPAQPPADQVETDPLAAEDLRVVNDEARRQGFTANIYFDLDKSDLLDASREALSRNAEFLRTHREFTLTLEGHCDERGTNEYNLSLGERRANSVKSYLASLGVAAERMVTISYGEERPVCTASEESCWSQNRRAHLLITGRKR